MAAIRTTADHAINLTMNFILILIFVVRTKPKLAW